MAMMAFLYAVLSQMCSWTFPVIIAVVIYRWLRKPHPNFPPGPLGFPIIGVMPYMSKFGLDTIFEWSKTYGPVLFARFPANPTVFLNTYEVIQEAFSKQSTKFSGRPIMQLLYEVTNDTSGIISKDYGHEWKLQRKLGNKVFRGFLFGDRGFQTIVQQEAKLVIEQPKKKIDLPIHLNVELSKATANVISKVVIGKRFDEGDSQFQALLGSEKTMGDPKDAVLLQLNMMFPITGRFPPVKWAVKRSAKIHLDILDLMHDFVIERQNNFNPDNIQCFVDAYLFQQQNSNPKEAAIFSKHELHSIVKDLYFAGIETSSHTLSWAFLIILHDPECQMKIQTEIDCVIGKDMPGLNHRESMPYTCAFLQEVLRFRSVVPYGAPHLTNADAKLNGYYIPKGTTVMANIWGVHNDPKNWTKPEKFDPLRHIDGNGNFVLSPRVISFSVGQRRCLGELLARSELFIFLVTILQNLNISKDPSLNGLPSLKGVMSGFFVPSEHKIVLACR
uniref:Cytochrome P450 2C42-like n=1 Tax=Phallusia mammillata TaxID=59560 RepID=A0A6F9DB02_9ASCI|nr:cytochrome P450 2C42-like [Phallusia mammillata]